MAHSHPMPKATKKSPKAALRARKPAAVSVPAGTPEKVLPPGTLKNMRRAVERTMEKMASSTLESIKVLSGLYPTGNEMRLPELPPGVIPAKEPAEVRLCMDGPYKEMARDSMPGQDALFGWGNGFLGFGYFFQGYPYLAQLVQIAEYRAPSEMQANEMSRKWIKLKATDKKSNKEKQKDGIAQDAGFPAKPPADEPAEPKQNVQPTPADDPEAQELADKISEIEQCLEDMKVRQHFRQCEIYDGFFGRGQLFIRIKGQEGDEARQLPLLIDPESIGKGDLLGFQPIEPYWTTPYSYNSTDPTRPDFYKPTSWYVMGKKTHHTRLLAFISRPVPDLLKPAYNFGGLSWTQLLEPAVNMWLRTRKSVNDMIHNYSIIALMTDLATMLESPENGGLQGRAQLFANNRDNQGLMMLNKGTEEIAQVTVSLASLDKLQAQSQEHMAAIVHQPLVIMTGVTPSGLNASSEGEIQIWHEFINGCQINNWDGNLKLVLEAIQCHLFGMIDDRITWEWVPLDEPTATEQAANKKSDAERDNVYLTAGVVSPDEVRTKLSKDATSGYDGLSGEAPGPPAPPLDPNNMIPGDDDDEDEGGKPGG